MPDYLRTGGKCPYLAINVLSFPSSKCFCCRRCVLQQCLPAFVQEKIILEKFSHQVFDVSGSTYPRPRVMTCRCREPHMDTTLWLTMIWRSIAFDDDEEDDIWNHPTIHTSCIAGTVSGDWEGEVWILGEVEAPAGSTSDLQVGDWRPQVRREGDYKEILEQDDVVAAQVTNLDKLHSQQQTEGENKYSTIQKVTIRYRRQTSNWCLDIKSISAFQVKRGSTSSRVAFFEEL